MLERVIPLIDHPSAEFISRVDKNLGELVKTTYVYIFLSNSLADLIIDDVFLSIIKYM